MAEARWFKFYTSDWLNSRDVFNLTLEQEGAYIRVLALMWEKGGSIPDDDNWIAHGLRCTPGKWRKIKAVFFDSAIIFEQNGELFNAKLSENLRTFNEKSQVYRKNADERWKKKAKKPNEINETDMQLQCNGYTREIRQDKNREEKIREEKKITPQIQESIDASRGTFFEKFVNGLVLKNTGVSIGDES
jgi:uncharacterized protein YdaU (DUF1376 family)